jgi:6-pyruvoyltetrahydropterin/6-carboxytetrahydropterin synthase
MNITCSKRYDDLPFAHRQPSHDGHCAWIHGHNWGFEFEFKATHLDECGFVIDFGKLKWLKAWLLERFDHTLVLNQNDPWLQFLTLHLEYVTDPNNLGGAKESTSLAKIFAVPDCSSEGLCQWLLAEVNRVVQSHTHGRVSLHRVTVIEDSKNAATIYAD